MTKQIKVRFGQGDMVLTKSTKYVGIRKSQSNTRSLMDESPLDAEIKKVRHPHLGGFEVVSVNKQKNEKLDDKKTLMRSLDEVEVVTNVYHIPGSEKPLVPTGSIYIQFASNVSQDAQLAILNGLNLALKERRSDTKLVAQCTPQSTNPVTAAIALGEKTEVKWAEPDMDAEVDHYAYTNPQASLMGQMWHLQNTGRIPDNAQVRMKPGADSKVVDAWKILDGYGNPNIVVAVIDNGFDISHPDLNTKIVRPWDLWNGSTQLRAGDAYFTHGTPCAGVAIAPQTGGMCGSAPAARFMPVSGTGFSIESTEAMFNYVIRNGADVVSCSWGTVENGYQLSSDKIAAISKAARDGRNGKGCVICYAAGNEGVDYLNFYAQHPDVIAVGASTSDDDHADYSNTGPQLDIVAPSNGSWPILSARAYWDEGIPGEIGASRWYYGDGIDRGSRYQHFGGTSSATPLVAGICALILSANPNLTAREVKDIIRATADKIGSPSEYYNGRSVRYGYGRINAAKAVTEALRRAGKTTTSSGSSSTSGSSSGSSSGSGSTSGTTSGTGSTSTPSGSPSGSGLFRYGTNARLASRGFSVQAGSFNQWTSVKNTAPALESRFKQPALIHVSGSTPTTMMYRILMGQFNTLGDANRFLSVLKAGGIAGFVRDLSSLT